MPNLDQVAADLQAVICDALAAVEQDSHHDLTYNLRCKINTELGMSPTLGDESVAFGHWRRYQLGLITTQAVLPLWERAFPNDNGPHTWLKAARDVMTGQCGAANFQKMREEGWAHCDDLVYEHQELQNTVAVGYAALQVLRIALWDNLYPESHLVTDLSEDECDPEDTDCAFCAACAWAGGTKWDETSSAEQRLAFWRWWLTEAVPAAWLANPPQ